MTKDLERVKIFKNVSFIKILRYAQNDRRSGYIDEQSVLQFSLRYWDYNIYRGICLMLLRAGRQK